MRPGKMTLLALICIAIGGSCNSNPPNPKKSTNQMLLGGYWIPKQIQKGIDSLNKTDTTNVSTQPPPFQTLCFDSSATFIMFKSIRGTTPRHKKAVFFAAGPSFEMYAGSWKDLDTSIEVNYKTVAKTLTPTDSAFRNERIKILFNGPDTFLLYRSELYQRTSQYDSLSRLQVEIYKQSLLRGNRLTWH